MGSRCKRKPIAGCRLGSIRNVVSADETLQSTYDYYAFGNMLGATDAVYCCDYTDRMTK